MCAALFGFGLEGVDALGCDGPVVLAAVLNGVLAHEVEVVEQVGALAGGVVEHGAVVGLLIGDGRGVVPELRLDGIDKVVARELLIGQQRQRLGRGIADDLGQEADLVVEVGDGAEAAVEPGGVGRAAARGGTGLVLFDETLVHGGADGFDAEDDERVIEVAVGVAEGRHEDDGASGAGLVVVVDDLADTRRGRGCG